MKRLHIAHHIKDLRKQKSWSQELLATHAGVSVRTIQRLESSGQCSHETLLAMASVFDVDITEFTSLTVYQSEQIEVSKKGIYSKILSLFDPIIDYISSIDRKTYSRFTWASAMLLVLPIIHVIERLTDRAEVSEQVIPFLGLLKSIPSLSSVLFSPTFSLISLGLAALFVCIPLLGGYFKDQRISMFNFGNRIRVIALSVSCLLFTSIATGEASRIISERAVEQYVYDEQQRTNDVLISGYLTSAIEQLRDVPVGLQVHIDETEKVKDDYVALAHIQGTDVGERIFGKDRIYDAEFNELKSVLEASIQEDEQLSASLIKYDAFLKGKFDDTLMNVIKSSVFIYSETYVEGKGKQVVFHDPVSSQYEFLKKELNKGLEEQKALLATLIDNGQARLTPEELEGRIEELKTIHLTKYWTRERLLSLNRSLVQKKRNHEKIMAQNS